MKNSSKDFVEWLLHVDCGEYNVLGRDLAQDYNLPEKCSLIIPYLRSNRASVKAIKAMRKALADYQQHLERLQ